jgi:hypothetical protein
MLDRDCIQIILFTRNTKCANQRPLWAEWQTEAGASNPAFLLRRHKIRD